MDQTDHPDVQIDVDPHELPESHADAGPQGPSSRSRAALVLAVSVAVLFAVAAVGLAVLLAGRGDDGELDELRQTAGRFGAALVTYDYHDPDAHRDAVLDFATGSFREEYQDAFDQGLGQIITEVQAVSTGYVKDVYLSAVDEERAQAIVVVDIEHDGTSGPNTLYDVYFRVTLVDVGGAWKVDQVTDLNFDTGGATAPGGSGDGADTTAPTAASATTSVP
jgi:hypothetical protein